MFDLAELPTERLEHEITELAAHLNAGTCRWLELVAEFDRRGVSVRLRLPLLRRVGRLAVRSEHAIGA